MTNKSFLAHIPGQSKKKKKNNNYSQSALRLGTELTTTPAELFIG